MRPERGIFIVLEGPDGSGKATQFKLLAARLKAVGFDVEEFDFPRYDEASSHFVKSYLNGDYGPADKVSPYTASLFYALDRFEAAPAIRRSMADGKIVLSNRYVGSNMAHQGAKLADPVEQRSFFVWEDSLEYQLLGIPRPDINIFLNVPAEIAYEMIAKKAKRNYTRLSRDEHEKDIEHLRQTVKTYKLLCQLFPKDYRAVEVSIADKMLPVTAANDKIWEAVKPLLPARPPNKARGVTLQLNTLLVNKRREGIANEDETPPATVSTGPAPAKTAELNKVSLLVANQIGLSEDLLVSINQIEWPKNRKAYYTPQLSTKMGKIYQSSIDKMAGAYNDLDSKVQKLSKKTSSETSGGSIELLKRVLPLACLCSVTIKGDAGTLRRLADRLSASELDEIAWSGHQLKAALGIKEGPQSLKKLAKAGRSSDETPELETINRLVNENLPQTLPKEPAAVTLLQAWPRNELDLVVDGLYSHSDLPRADLEQILEQWKYEDKKKALVASISQKGSVLPEQIVYKWEVVIDQLQLADLLKSLGARSIQLKTPTPRYGYEIPEIIEEAGLENLYHSCYDESLQLFSRLQAAALVALTPYATLWGHKVRCEFITDGRALFAALESRGRGRLPMLDEMAEQIGQVHPLLAGTLLVADKTTAAPRNNQPSKSSRRSARRRAASKRKK
jgi:dTMP kinase